MTTSRKLISGLHSSPKCAILLALLCSLPFHATAKSWQEAINDVNALSEKYKLAAETASGESITYFLGTAHGTMDMEMHMCAILGRWMGFAEHIGHLEPPQPSMDSEPITLANSYASLSNWTYTAKRFANLSQHERTLRWNYECVGKQGIPSHLEVDVPDEVFFHAEGLVAQIGG